MMGAWDPLGTATAWRDAASQLLADALAGPTTSPPPSGFEALRTPPEIAAYLRHRGGRATFTCTCRRLRPRPSPATPQEADAQARKDFSRDAVVVRDGRGGSTTVREAAEYDAVVDTLATAAARTVTAAFKRQRRKRKSGSPAAAAASPVVKRPPSLKTTTTTTSPSEQQPPLARPQPLRRSSSSCSSVADAEEAIDALAQDGHIARLAREALRAVTRTESGGVAFEALSTLLRGRLLVVADSKNAQPLRIDLDVGPCAELNGADGLCVAVEGTTQYRLFEPTFPVDGGASSSCSGPSECPPLATATAVYRNHLLLPLDSAALHHGGPGPLTVHGGGPPSPEGGGGLKSSPGLAAGLGEVLFDRDNANITIHIDAYNRDAPAAVAAPSSS